MGIEGYCCGVQGNIGVNGMSIGERRSLRGIEIIILQPIRVSKRNSFTP